jgi:DNA modification methylase
MKFIAKPLFLINRIYELRLCELEIKMLGGENIIFDFEKELFIFDGRKEIFESLLKRSSWLERINNEETLIYKIVNSQKEIIKKYNDLWFSHICYPFKARFRPIVARSLINITNPKLEGIGLDPFVGSGTTLIEAGLLGSPCIGIDINPFYVYMSNAKCEFFREKISDERAINYWYTYSKKEGKEKEIFYERVEDKDFHPLFKVVLSYTDCMHVKKPAESFLQRIRELCLLQQYFFNLNLSFLPKDKVYAEIGDCIDLSKYPDCYFSYIITSPPYSIAIDYLKENPAHPAFFVIGEEVKEKYRSCKKIKDWYIMMERATSEMARVLKNNGKLAIILGNNKIKNKIINLTEWTINRFEKLGLKLLYDIPQLISSTGTHNILIDHILIFEKLK